jgi:peptide subunit release factor 1 (eRF1)
LEPFFKVNQITFLCDNKFHTEFLNEIISSSKYLLFNNFENLPPAVSSDNISPKKICVGTDDCVKCLQFGAVSVIIVREKMEIVEWLVENHKNFGCELRFDSQNFIEKLEKNLGKSTDGIVGFLRYEVELV